MTTKLTSKMAGAVWDDQFDLLAETCLRRSQLKVRDQLVDRFVLAVADENSHVDTTAGKYVFGPSKPREETEPNLVKVEVLVTTYFFGVQQS